MVVCIIMAVTQIQCQYAGVGFPNQTLEIRLSCGESQS